MNSLIAAVVGGLLASALLVGGVKAAQGDQKPVSESTLYSYASQ